MLQGLRDYFPKWLFASFLGVLGLLIVGAGIYPFYRGTQSQRALVRINGTKIRYSQLERAYESFKQEAQKNAGSNITTEVENELRAHVLKQLIMREVLKQRAYLNGYRIHPKDTLHTVQKMPIFQAEGQFSPKRFVEVLSLTDYTKASFLNEITNEKLINQLVSTLVKSAFILPEEVHQFIRLAHQKRDFSYLELKAEDFLKSSVSLSEEEMRTYYEASLADFRIPETVSIDYIVIPYQDILKATKAIHTKNDDLKDVKASESFKESVDYLARLSDKTPFSLAEIAKTFDVTIHSTPFFSREGGSTHITAHPDVVSAAFSQRVLKGYNSVPLRLDANHIILLRVKQHEPLRLPAFDEVKEKVKDRLCFKKAQEAAQAYGAQLVEKLKERPTSFFSLPRGSQWRKVTQAKRDDIMTPALILQAAFAMPYQSQAPRVEKLLMPNGNCVIIRLTQVSQGEVKQLDKKQYELYKEELKQMTGQLDYIQYARANEKRAKIDYLFNFSV